MMNRPIDGRIMQARLVRARFGQRVYSEVAIRRHDGTSITLGKIVAARALADALVPGQEGRFYFHDILGAQGLHGHRRTDGTEIHDFPVGMEWALAALALVNLIVAGACLNSAAGLCLLPLVLGVMALIGWIASRACRQAILHDLNHERRVAEQFAPSMHAA